MTDAPLFLPLLLGGVLALAALALLFHMWRTLRTRGRLSAQSRGQLLRAWQHAAALPDPVRRVLEAEKVVDQLLTMLGYRGSFGEKLTAAGARFGNIEAVWRAHKMRNRLAHEPGATVGEQGATQALAAFEQLLKPFLRG